MSKSFKYVSEFSFPSEAGYSGSAGKTAVKGYYRGGDVSGTKNVIRNEREELNRVEAKRKDAGQEVKRVKAEMRYDKSELKGAKKPGPMMLKKGGQAKGMAKVGKVMGEYKEGKLHSGSKKGPEVTNRKQAVAIALNEARSAGAKIPMKKAGGGAISDKDARMARGAREGALSQVAKKVGSRMSESVSSRPVDSKGRPVSMDQLNRMNRDIGAMSDADVKYMRDAMKRAERIQSEEAGESRLMRRAKGGYMHGGMHQKKK